MKSGNFHPYEFYSHRVKKKNKKVNFGFTNYRMEQFSHEELIPPMDGIDGLNMLWNAHNEINKFDKQPTIGGEERVLSKVIFKTDLNICDKEIHLLTLSRNDYNIVEHTVDQLSINKRKRKYQENKSFGSNSVLNKNQNLIYDSKQSESINHEASTLFRTLKTKYKTSVPTKLQKDIHHKGKSERDITKRQENSIIALTQNEPISIRKHRSIKNNDNISSETSNSDQDERIKAQIEHDTFILTNYLNQFDSLTAQIIKNMKAKRMKK